VAQAAQSMTSGATQTQAAAQELAQLATELQAVVGQFKYGENAYERKPTLSERSGKRVISQQAQPCMRAVTPHPG
jgi:hypothetical protein